MNRDQVFISYSHADSEWLERLQTMLAPLQRQGALDVWADTRIQPGQLWKEEIQNALARAKVGVLLVSPDFLASEFIAEHEFPSLLEAASKEGLTILWVLVRHSLYEETEIARYQAAYDPRTPLSTLTAAEQDAALLQIAEKVKAITSTVTQLDSKQSTLMAAEQNAGLLQIAEKVKPVTSTVTQLESRRGCTVQVVLMLVLVLTTTTLYLERFYQTTESEPSSVKPMSPPLPPLEQSSVAEAPRVLEEEMAAEAPRALEPERAAELWRLAEAQRQATQAEGALQPKINIYGLSVQDVQALQTLQQRTAQTLKMSVEFQDTLKDGSPGPKMVLIPEGKFSMGSPENEKSRNDDEHQHPVQIKQNFAIGKTEVTVGQFQRFVEATGYRTEAETAPSCYSWDGKVWQQAAGKNWRNPGFKQDDQHPVVCVSWNDALKYTEWLSQQTGQKYRLPTEAEWEYAARAGTTTSFYFGTTISTDQANYNGNYTYGGGQKGVYRQKTVQVGQFPANALDLYDMHGNVWEWTCSEYNESYSGAELVCVSSVNSGGPRVVRGGSWFSDPKWLRSAARLWNYPRGWTNYIGFRLARTF